jgi:hypothetical protein
MLLANYLISKSVHNLAIKENHSKYYLFLFPYRGQNVSGSVQEKWHRQII